MVTNTKLRGHLSNFTTDLVIGYFLTIAWGVFLNNYGIAIAAYVLFGIPQMLILSLAIYAAYYLVLKLLYKYIQNVAARWLAVALSVLIYGLVILFIEWELQQDLYNNFLDFINESNYYLLFTVTAVIQIIISKVRREPENANG